MSERPTGILIVDDEPAWLRSMSLTLERAGLGRAETCQDPREVMDRLRRDAIAVVLLDLTMPHLSGEELLARITA